MFGIKRHYDLRRAVKALIYWGLPLALATGVLLGVLHADAVVVALVIVLFVVAIVPPVLVFSFRRPNEVGSTSGPDRLST